MAAAPGASASSASLENGQPNEALQKTGPQQRVNSDRRYGCYYGSNVLLYTATVIGKN